MYGAVKQARVGLLLKGDVLTGREGPLKNFHTPFCLSLSHTHTHTVFLICAMRGPPPDSCGRTCPPSPPRAHCVALLHYLVCYFFSPHWSIAPTSQRRLINYGWTQDGGGIERERGFFCGGGGWIFKKNEQISTSLHMCSVFGALLIYILSDFQSR